MSPRIPRLVAAVALLAGALTVGIAAPAFAENSPTSTPVAVDDDYGMMGGTTLTVDAVAGILVNDLHAADWTIRFVEAVQNDVPGELSYDMWGGFSYTPAAGFSGVRTFEYQVRDGDLGVVSENWGTVTITVLDPTLPCAVGTPGCEAPDPGPGDLPCAVGAPGCIPTELPPCDPDGPEMEAPAPGEPATCIPGEPTDPVDELPCAVGTPGCTPPAILPCDPNALPQEVGNAVPCLPVDLDIPTPTSGGDGTTSTTDVQLETLAYTGETADYRLAGLAAALLLGGVLLLLPRRKTA